MKKNDNLLLGKKGEELACQFLKAEGFIILERNVQKRYGEIDIVAGEGDTLVFVEVKTRNSEKYGQPEEAVTSKKIKSLLRSCHYYLLVHQYQQRSFRLDVISILYCATGQFTLKHFKNITL